MNSATGDRQVAAVLECYRRIRSPRLVICWWQDPPRPRDLGAGLQGRGFGAIDWLNWMGLDLDRRRAVDEEAGGRRVSPGSSAHRREWNEGLPGQVVFRSRRKTERRHLRR